MHLKDKKAHILDAVKPHKFNSKDNSLEIEITDIVENDWGVTVFVKAWRDGKQLGFGDGTIEIEKIRMINPPVDVPDGTLRSVESRHGPVNIPNLKLDPLLAMQTDLLHTVSLIARNGDAIVPGKVGTTVSTFYPSASAVDGGVGDDQNVNWQTHINDPGNNSQYSQVYFEGYIITSFSIGATIGTRNGKTYTSLNKINGKLRTSLGNRNGITVNTGLWNRLWRGIVMFDTSAIPDGDTISAATLSGYGYDKLDDVGITPNINVYASTPASTTALVNGDYAQVGNVPLCDTPLPYASQTVGAYNDFVLNAAGIANIDKTGISKFGFRNANYDVAGISPTPLSTAQDSKFQFYGYAAGGGSTPKLVVTHAP